MNSKIVGFMILMWVLIIAGGGIVVTVLGPISISGFGELNWFVNSALKATVAIVLVVVWIMILARLKNLVFRKEIGF